MVPFEWPIAAAAEGGAHPAARAAGFGRLSVVRADFFLDPRARLTEQERALMTTMLADLIGNLADEFAALLGPAEPANDHEEPAFDTLWKARLLDIPDLLRLLLRRAEEERLSAGVRAGRASNGGRFLQSFVGDEDSDISAAAMALILARSRRRDRFGGPRVIFDDLSAEAAVSLSNAIAAVLRNDLAKRIDMAEADERITTAAQAIVSRHDEGNRLEARLFELVHALDRSGRIDEKFISSTLDAGELAILAEALGRRAGIAFDSAWDHFVAGSGNLARLLRLGNLSRNVAGEIIAALAEIVGADAEEEMSAFGQLTEEQVENARKWLRLDPAYRSAIRALASVDGQRSL
jgi:hypothetical protein